MNPKRIRKFALPALLVAAALSIVHYRLSTASDYHEQTPRPAQGIVGTPALAVRTDRPRDLATQLSYPQNGAGNLVVEQVDSVGNKRVAIDGGKPTFRATFSQIAPDSTGTDIAFLQGSGCIDVQTLTTTGTVLSGGFTLGDTSNSGAAATTGVIAWNATADQIRIGLELLPQIGKGNISVTGTALPAGTVTIKFVGQLAGYHAALVVTPVNLLGTSPVVVNTHTTLGWNNQQTLTAASGTTGGTLTLTYVHPATGQSVTTAAIAYNASAATVVGAMNTALLGLTGNAGGSGYCVATVPIGGGSNGALQTNPVTLSFAGTLNNDQLLLGYDEGNNPSATMAITNVNARIIKIRQIRINTIATTAAGGLLKIMKTTTHATTGATIVSGQGVTATALSFTPLELTEYPSVATAGYYTVHPTTPVTAASILVSENLDQQLAATNGAMVTIVFNFENLSGCKLPKLMGFADQYVFNVAAALTASGNAFTIEIDYSEEQFSS